MKSFLFQNYSSGKKGTVRKVGVCQRAVQAFCSQSAEYHYPASFMCLNMINVVIRVDVVIAFRELCSFVCLFVFCQQSVILEHFAATVLLVALVFLQSERKPTHALLFGWVKHILNVSNNLLPECLEWNFKRFKKRIDGTY